MLGFFDSERVGAFLALEVVLKVLAYHISGDIAGRHCKVATCPEMLSPVSLLEFWEFHLEFTRGLTLEVLHKCGECDTGVYGEQEVYVVRCHCSGKDLHTIFNADLTNEYLGTLTDVAFQYFVPVLGNPREVYLDVENGVGSFPILCGHTSIILK